MPHQLVFRVVSGILVAVVAVGAILLGPPWLTILGLAGGLIAISETYRLTPVGVGRMPLALGALAVVVLLLAAQAAAGTADYLAASGIALAFWGLAASLWFTAAYQDGNRDGNQDGNQDGRPLAAFLLLLLGPVYVGFLLGHGLAIYDLSPSGTAEAGRNWLLFALAGTTASDTGAYAVGRLLGRHRMTPRLSPGKTWEGAAGGLAASVPAMLAVGILVDLGVEPWEFAVVALVVAVLAQVGDLFESFLKRTADAKDSGSIMPGHGGLLDRIDSMLFALPAVYYLVAMVFGP